MLKPMNIKLITYYLLLARSAIQPNICPADQISSGSIFNSLNLAANLSAFS